MNRSMNCPQKWFLTPCPALRLNQTKSNQIKPWMIWNACNAFGGMLLIAILFALFSSRAHLAALFASLLDKAFKGEL